MKCGICHKEPDPTCDYKQGRCPHRKPMIEIQSKTRNGHFYVSLVKSAIRVVAGVSIINGNLIAAGVLLIAAEILGIVEELV